MPDISIVIPLYNKRTHIRRAIDSVLSQTRQDFEIFVVDDGSTDGSAAVVRAIDDSRIRLIVQKNAGVSVARNTGIHAATSDVVAFLDADDAYRSDFLHNLWQLRSQHPQAMAWAMNYQTVEPDGSVGLGVAVGGHSPLLLNTQDFVRIARDGSPVHSSSVAANRSALLKIGGFPPGVKLGEDIDTWLRLSFEGPIVFDYRPGGIYYRDAEDRACLINPPPPSYIFFGTIDRWAATQSLSPPEIDDIAEFKNFFAVVYAWHQLRRGDVRLGRTAMLKCRTRHFLRQKTNIILLSLIPRKPLDLLATLRRRFRA